VFLRGVFILICSVALVAQEGTVILLRHAEKSSRLDNAELSIRGLQRAAALAGELAPFQPVALFATDFRRTQQTLEPLAKRLGLPIQVRPRGEESALAQELRRDYLGKVVVVCSHSDRVALLIEALGVPTQMAEVRAYDQLWILRWSGAGSHLETREQKALPHP